MKEGNIQIDTTNCGPVVAYEKLSSATYFQYPLDKWAFGKEKGYVRSFALFGGRSESN